MKDLLNRLVVLVIL